MTPELTNEVVQFAKELVQIPSQNGIDSERRIAKRVAEKLESFGFQPKRIGEEYRPSIICDLQQNSDAKTVWLQACLDTVPAGALENWSKLPFAGDIIDGKMYGRGVADCKVAIAIFCYLARELRQNNAFNGNIFLGFDADEQSGTFTGIRNIINYAPQKADICILGYQGMDEISIGARGWARAEIRVIGKAHHTGSRKKKGVNAIHGMGRIICALKDMKVNGKTDPYFWFGSRTNIAKIEGGTAINVVPDFCSAEADIRTVPSQTPESVVEQMHTLIKKDIKKHGPIEYEIELRQGEDAHITDPKNTFVRTLQKTATTILNKNIPLVASGQGSVGNVVSKTGIPIINAFGCDSGNVHAPDEWVDITTIPKVFEIYEKAIVEFYSE